MTQDVEIKQEPDGRWSCYWREQALTNYRNTYEEIVAVAARQQEISDFRRALWAWWKR